jgi:hypothetical protein
MNVTVLIPRSLKTAVEGKAKLSLGLPPSADLGDLVEALFTLYPKLRLHLASDQGAKAQQLNLYLADASSPGLSWRGRLKEGQTLYLSAPPAKRLAS